MTREASAAAFPAVIGIGASAGGVEALSSLIGALPEDFGAPILVVLHISPAGTSVLPDILARRTKLGVSSAVDGTTLRAGQVYVAPPDQHLIVRDGAVRVNREPRENGHRPAVDATLRAIAHDYRSRAVGVILSGTRDDGSRGLAAVKAGGGHALVQNPAECQYTGMPESAIRATAVDAVLSIADLAERLSSIAADASGHTPHPVSTSGDPDEVNDRAPTRFTCPDCGGVLFGEDQNGAETYICSVGHAYSPDSLQEEQARLLESALWAAVRSLEDRAVLLRRLAVRASGRGHERSHASFESQAADAAERANLIRGIATQPTTGPDGD